MTKLQLLSAYLTERLTAMVKEVLDVVEDTVSEYREETARTRRENESLRRQLRDILLLEAETEWLNLCPLISHNIMTTDGCRKVCRHRIKNKPNWFHLDPETTADVQRPTGVQEKTGQDQGSSRSGPDQNLSDPESRTHSDKPDSSLDQTRQPQLVPVLKEMPPAPVYLLGDEKPADVWEPAPTSDPCQEAFGRTSPLQTQPSLNLPIMHLDDLALREEPVARVKREPEEVKEAELHVESYAATEESDFERAEADLALQDAHRNRKSCQETQLADDVAAGSLIPELVHRCPRCGEAFGQAAGLRLHLDQKRKTYACNWCCKSFAQSADLRRHLRTHTGERPHRCTFCSKSFSQRGNLRRHLRIHTGERPYGCPFCCRTFSDGDTMKKHKRTHAAERATRCAPCSTTFSTAAGLQPHLEKDACCSSTT